MNGKNGKTWSAIRIIWPILMFIGGGLIAWAAMAGSVCEKVKNIQTIEIPAMKKQLTVQEQEQKQLQYQYYMLNEGITRIDTKLDSMSGNFDDKILDVKDDIKELKEELRER